MIALLNEEVWPGLPRPYKVAVIDHELKHVATDVDSDGEIVYMMKGHDLEEFRDVYARHGPYRSDIQAFLDAPKNAQAKMLLDGGGRKDG